MPSAPPPPSGRAGADAEVEILDEQWPDTPTRGRLSRLLHPFVLLVILPTLLAVGFEYLVASDQYQSEAYFAVKGPSSSANGSGLSQMLGLGGNNASTAAADAHSVTAYLLSHDAIDALAPTVDLVRIFRRPEADRFTRLRFAHPKPETLLRYYQRQIHLTYSSETSLTQLTARAFRAADAKLLADNLLRLGEQRVNALNARMLSDGLSVANEQVRAAETQIETTRVAMTRFRLSHRDIDPERSGTAEIDVETKLQAEALQARASYEAMAAVLPPTAPQLASSARQVRALESKIAAVQAGLAGAGASLANGLGEFEKLKVDQEYAAKNYETASAALQTAREQLLKQQLFIIPVVQPNLPGKALYPERLKIVAIIFFGLTLTYAVGWLILAGMREHAA